MLDYLLETRRQMIKLLVLVKWARVSREVDQCIVLPTPDIRELRFNSAFVGCRAFPSRTKELLQ